MSNQPRRWLGISRDVAGTSVEERLTLTTLARPRCLGRGCRLGAVRAATAPAPAATLAAAAAASPTSLPPDGLPKSPPPTSLQYYPSRDVAFRLKHQEELRRRSGPEAPPCHAAAREEARLKGLGQQEGEEQVGNRLTCRFGMGMGDSLHDAAPGAISLASAVNARLSPRREPGDPGHRPCLTATCCCSPAACPP